MIHHKRLVVWDHLGQKVHWINALGSSDSNKFTMIPIFHRHLEEVLPPDAVNKEAIDAHSCQYFVG